MDCCGSRTIQNLESAFDRTLADEEASAYIGAGLARRGEQLIAYLVENCSGPLSVLDIGSGVGGIHYELLRRGVADSVVGVEVSSAYIDAARSIGEQLRLDGRAQYVHGDFTAVADEIDSADVVILDRVICCYPHLQALLGASARKARRYLALSYPGERLWTRIRLGLDCALRKVRGQAFRLYLHPHSEVRAIAVRDGLRPVHTDTDGFWQITVFERA